MVSARTRIPTIAELEAMVEAAKANPKRKRRRTGRTTQTSRKPSKRTNYAAQVCARGVAMGELVQRVNEKPAKAIVVDDKAIPYRGEGWHYSEDADWKVEPL